jgi:hypothetical protein
VTPSAARASPLAGRLITGATVKLKEIAGDLSCCAARRAERTRRHARFDRSR